MWLLDLVLPCNIWSGPGQYVADHLVLADRTWQLDLVLPVPCNMVGARTIILCSSVHEARQLDSILCIFLPVSHSILSPCLCGCTALLFCDLLHLKHTQEFIFNKTLE